MCPLTSCAGVRCSRLSLLVVWLTGWLALSRTTKNSQISLSSTLWLSSLASVSALKVICIALCTVFSSALIFLHSYSSLVVYSYCIIVWMVQESARVLRIADASRAARAPEAGARDVNQRHALLGARRGRHPRRGSHTGPCHLFHLSSRLTYSSFLFCKLLHWSLILEMDLILRGDAQTADACRPAREQPPTRVHHQTAAFWSASSAFIE